MTTKEFTFWIEGYITGGGNDIKVIQDKIATIKDVEPSIVPYRVPYIVPDNPYDPEYNIPPLSTKEYYYFPDIIYTTNTFNT